ncbi:MAG: hypothetical protein WAM28_08130, partial [Chlamydiales bacterium]
LIKQVLHNDPAYHQIGRYIKSEEFRKMPEAVLQSAVTQRYRSLSVELANSAVEFTFLEAEALAERGEKELALEFITFCEAFIASQPQNFFFKAIAAKAIIDFEKALEYINKLGRNRNYYILGLFCNFDFFSKTKLTSKELRQKLPSSFFDSDERRYFSYVLQQVAEGNPIKEVREISNSLSILTFRVYTLCWCAREIASSNRHLAVKYLEEAIEQASKTEDVRAFLMNFKVILSVSTKIT